MRILFIAFFVFTYSFPVFSQEGATTVILVRHAEKHADGSQDPDLSTEGKQRAERLAQVLAHQRIDQIFSTNYKRTKNTAAPVASAKQLTVETYNPSDPGLKTMVENSKGKTLLIVGHSNTIPALANLLLGEKRFNDFADTEYNNLIVITLAPQVKPTAVWLTY